MILPFSLPWRRAQVQKVLQSLFYRAWLLVCTAIITSLDTAGYKVYKLSILLARVLRLQPYMYATTPSLQPYMYIRYYA